MSPRPSFSFLKHIYIENVYLENSEIQNFLFTFQMNPRLSINLDTFYFILKLNLLTYGRGRKRGMLGCLCGGQRTPFGTWFSLFSHESWGLNSYQEAWQLIPAE